MDCVRLDLTDSTCTCAACEWNTVSWMEVAPAKVADIDFTMAKTAHTVRGVGPLNGGQEKNSDVTITKGTIAVSTP